MKRLVLLLLFLPLSAFAVGPGHFGPGPLRPHEPVIVHYPIMGPVINGRH
jgi:hypothetical protein